VIKENNNKQKTKTKTKKPTKTKQTKNPKKSMGRDEQIRNKQTKAPGSGSIDFQC
jgi:hypothetical protein